MLSVIDVSWSEDAIQMLFGSDNGALVAMEKPLTAAPGTSWYYSSGTSNLLSLLLKRNLEAGGENYLDYPKTALFAPLGMKSAVLEPDPAGVFVASSFGYASAVDWARFGLLYLHGGRAGSRRLLPEGWARRACTSSEVSGHRYGQQFWTKLSRRYTNLEQQKTLPEDTCYAVGHDGQSVTIIPSHDLVVVRLGFTPQSGVWNHAGFLLSILEHLQS